MGNTITLVHGDCFEILKQIPAGSIDLLLTDPPYGTTSLPFDSLTFDWALWWKQIHRVCRRPAMMLCFGAQPFATDLINSNRRLFRYDLIWHKTSAVGFLAANKRPLRAHEHLLVFRQMPSQARGVKEFPIYNPQFAEGKPYRHRARCRPAAHYGKVSGDRDYNNVGKRYPTSVLTYARDARSLHPTQKPLELLRWLIRTYSHAGQRVLDPFMGSGSTGEAALLEGRQFTGIEMDAQYFALAEKRIRDREGRGA